MEAGVSERGYLGWHDADKKTTPAAKIADACACYERKWGEPATIALCNVVDVCWVDGVEVRAVAHVAPNVFFVGRES